MKSFTNRIVAYTLVCIASVNSATSPGKYGRLQKMRRNTWLLIMSPHPSQLAYACSRPVTFLLTEGQLATAKYIDKMPQPFVAITTLPADARYASI